MAKRRVTPRTFFLNETHELTPSEKKGGGGIPKYEGISWAAKATRISQSLRTVADEVEQSNDPLKDDRYFVLTLPVARIKKRSEDKRRAPEGTYEEETHFGAEHGKVFDRLGLDLLQVTDDGRAVVHAEREKFEQLLHRTESLDSLGQREQARWATIDSFETVPLGLRVDASWLQHIRTDEIADIVIELQPVLARTDADRVLRTIADLLVQRQGEKLTGTGTDFSGRYWFRGKAKRQSIRTIARDFFSVQSIHSPLFSIAAAKTPIRTARVATSRQMGPLPSDLASLPCVAVVDTGVPNDHVRLRPYRRGQFYAQDAPRAAVGDHGSLVASRIVFGDCQTHNELTQATGNCTYFDAIVADYPMVNPGLNRVNDKLVMEALRGVRGASPDVRVFNLSFGDHRALNDFPAVERREKRVLLQDLDNFVFANDCLVVVAAGNSPPGVPPNQSYPDHHTDERWDLWTLGLRVQHDGLRIVCVPVVSEWIGDKPGLAQPIFTHWTWPLRLPYPIVQCRGGNADNAYRFRPGLGVWGFSASGLPEDHAGTSFAAPILAREAALTLQELQRFCVPGTQPFAVTAGPALTNGLFR